EQIADVVLGAQDARLAEHPGEGLLDEVFGLLTRAAEAPCGAIQAIDVIAERLWIELPFGRHTRPWPAYAVRAGASRSALKLRQRPRRGPDVLGRRPDQPALPLLLQDVRRPAGGPSAGEHRREEIRWNVGEVEHHGGPELDVGGEHAVRLARLKLGQRGGL